MGERRRTEDEGRAAIAHPPSSIPRISSRILGPPALFLLLSAAFLWQPLLTGKVFLPTDLNYQYDYLWLGKATNFGALNAQNPLLSDISDYYYPYANYAMSRLRSGHFPLWNPYILTGTPFFASAQAAVLDPVNLLTYLAGPYAYWTWAALIRLALLGLGTYAFMRCIGRSVAAGLASGVVFMVCGFVVAWLNYSVVTSLVWMPALFWASTRFVQTGHIAWGAASALTIGGLLLGGHPETQFLIGLVWVIYCLYTLTVVRPQGSGAGATRQRAMFLAMMGLLGVGLSAVQLLPLVDFLLKSNSITERTMSLVPFDVGRTALYAIVLLFPNFSGTPTRNNYWVQPFTNFNEQIGYIGLLALAMAAVGFTYWIRRDRRVPFFAVLGVVMVLLQIRAPGFHLVKALPVFSVGHGVRWMLAASFCGAILAGYGMDALLSLQADRRRLRNAGLWLLGGAIIAFGVLLTIYIGIRDYNWDQSWGSLLSHVKMARLFHPASITLYWPVIFLAAGAVVVLAGWRGLLKAPSMASLLIILLYADLWTFGSGYNPVVARQAIDPPTKTVSYLQEHIGHERFVGTLNVFRPNIPMLFQIHDLRGYEDLIDTHFAQLYAPLDQMLDISKKKSLRLRPNEHRLLQIAGVRYVLTMRKPHLASDASAYKWLFEDNRVATYESTQALPRAYVVFSATIAPNIESAAATLLAPDHDPTRAIVLTGDSTGSKVGYSSDPIPARANAPVTWLRDEPEDVELQATMPAPGYLVLSDSYTPDWQATVDGKNAPLLRANVVYRAVALSPGTHTVGFVYRPSLFYVSATISAISTLVLLALAVMSMAARRSPARQPSAELQVQAR